MSNPAVPFPPPLPRKDDSNEEIVTTEVDGETTLDPDANDELIDSAEADRLAAEGGSPTH